MQDSLDSNISNILLHRVDHAIQSLLADPLALVYDFATADTKPPEASSRKSKKTPERPPLSSGKTTHFDWTVDALHLREEIAKLAGIGTTDVDEYSSIFELGLDSIDAIKLTSRVKTHGIDLSLSTIMRSRTIANMVMEMTTPPAGKKTYENHALQRYEHDLFAYVSGTLHTLNDVDRVLPATPLQEAMVAQMLDSNYTRYFNRDLLQIEPAIDLKRLEEAWHRVVVETPILRTSFIQVDDPNIPTTFAQIIHRSASFSWRVDDIPSHLDARQRLNELMNKAPALSADMPPWTLQLVRCQHASFLSLSMSHALYDGHSIELLHRAVHRAYRGSLPTEPSYVPILENILRSSGTEAAQFWRDSLSGAEPCIFPLQTSQTGDAVHRKEQSSSLDMRAVATFCKDRKITLQTLGQTCWAIMLAHQVRKLDVVFGTVLSGRDTDEAQTVNFPTMNTVAVRSVLHGSLKDMLEYMQENSAKHAQYQHFPLRNAQSFGKYKERQLFNTLFIYQKRPRPGEAPLEVFYRSIAENSEVEVRIL